MRYNMVVPKSCVAFMVPGIVTCSRLRLHSHHGYINADPYGILEENEVQIKSSHRNLYWT